MSTKTIVSPVPYVATHDNDEYPEEKIEIELQNAAYRKRNVKVWTAKRGVEGLLYCFDAFKKQCMDKFAFDIDDIEEHFPAMLDTEAERRWNVVWSSVPAAEKSVERFEQEFSNFVTIVSGSANPRDDLIEYITHSTECKKKRNVDVDVHVSRIVTLCLLANRLKGAAAVLTEEQITLAVFSSFPEVWQNNFRLHRGRSVNFSREEIVAYFRDNKAIQDSKEDDNKSAKKRKGIKETPPTEGERKNKKGKTNMCRHHGTHPWSECSLNPRSKNSVLNPSSPFYRGGNGGRGHPRGRTGGIADGGRFQGRGGRGQYDHGRGRGGFAGGDRYNNNSNGNRNNDQYYGGDRGSDRGQEPRARDQQGQHYSPTPGQGRVADQYYQQQQQQQYHTPRSGGW
jgi:hypothetical protein